jgi:hypothetical protein
MVIARHLAVPPSGLELGAAKGWRRAGQLLGRAEMRVTRTTPQPVRDLDAKDCRHLPQDGENSLASTLTAKKQRQLEYCERDKSTTTLVSSQGV